MAAVVRGRSEARSDSNARTGSTIPMTRNRTAFTAAISNRLDTSVTTVDCPAAHDAADATWSPVAQPEVTG